AAPDWVPLLGVEGEFVGVPASAGYFRLKAELQRLHRIIISSIDAPAPNLGTAVPGLTKTVETSMPFKALGLHAHLVQATREMKYTEPTPIQAEAIPPILAGRDLIATAQTGTGKTAAFLLPILHRLMDLPAGSAQALIVTPTRELAQQIDEVCQGLAYHTKLRVALLVGGMPMGRQE